jgi:hypothetical protein
VKCEPNKRDEKPTVIHNRTRLTPLQHRKIKRSELSKRRGKHNKTNSFVCSQEEQITTVHQLLFYRVARFHKGVDGLIREEKCLNISIPQNRKQW